MEENQITPQAMPTTRQSVEPYLSQKLKLLSLFSMICVVFIHAYNYTNTFLQPTTMIAEGLHAGAFVQFLISNALTRFANPLFFAISGYLFFAAFKKLTFKGYLRKLGARCRTLLLPYVIWVAFWTGIAAFTVWAAGWNAFPVLSEKLGGLYAGEWWRVITDPVPFQAWYILDLFKLAIVSPLIFLLAKYLRWGAPLLAAIPWAIDFSIPYFVNCDGLLFFTLGAYFAIRDVPFPGKSHPIRRKPLAFALISVWIALCLTYTTLSSLGQKIGLPGAVLLVLYKLCVLSGFCSVFVIFDLLPERAKNCKFVNVLASCTFFIYILHEPLQHMAFQTVLRYTYADWAHMLCYFLLPVALVALAVGLSVGLRKLCPKLYAILTGSR